MQVTGAVIREQGVVFGVALMTNSAFADSAARKQFQSQVAVLPMFRGVPVVVATQDSRGVPTYWGRPDLVRFLARLHITQIPWRDYAVRAA
ncbi:hypothetical protein B7486_62445 [cyanobacterium TDX16]|nr:hypothetical protein B7486_62445 [cyanobacterium TDX16]